MNKKYLYLMALIGILLSHKSYAQTLPQYEWKSNGSTWIGKANGIASTDANKMMNMDVSGDSSLSSISKLTSPGDSVFPLTVTRNISEHFSDMPTARDFGMYLIPDQGGPDITWLDSYWGKINSSTPIILPSGTHWPDNRYVPNSDTTNKTTSSSFPIVTSFGAVSSRPGYNTKYGYGVPYYGDVVPSFTHDDSDFEFSRVDSNLSSAGLYMSLAQFDSVIDTPFEGGSTGQSDNQRSLLVRTTTTPSAQGTIGNFVSIMNSNGYNYWGEMDVNKWSHTIEHGTNWVWDNIQELYSAEPYYCDPNDTSVCFAEYMNEEDLYGVGPEDQRSSYDPSYHNRQMFWLTTNHNIKSGVSTNLDWKANMLVPLHKIILVKDSNNKEFMFSGVPTGHSGNVSYSITGTISGNKLTVTDISSGKTIVPNSTRIWDNTLPDEIIIVSQDSGNTGSTGVYTIKASINVNGFNINKNRSFTASDDITNSRFSTTGSTVPTWTFTTGDTFVDNTTTWTCIGPWQFDLGSVIAVGGANDPSNGYIERIGTLMSETTDYIYNSIFDMSKAAFDPSVSYKVFARLQENMWIDLSADGTKNGQNNHLFGYIQTDSNIGELQYNVSANASSDGKAFTGFQVGNDGTVDFPKLNTTHKGTGSHYLCIDDNGGIFKSDTACVTQ